MRAAIGQADYARARSSAYLLGDTPTWRENATLNVLAEA